jgi:hypothetical protein
MCLRSTAEEDWARLGCGTRPDLLLFLRENVGFAGFLELAIRNEIKCPPDLEVKTPK